MANVIRRIGLSLGADICWPICYEEIVRRLDLSIPHDGDRVSVDVERVFRGGGVREETRSREWYLAGVGLVASEWIEPLDGAPDGWLVSARVNGIVLPPEEP